MFGKELTQAMAKHFQVEPTEIDLAEMQYGYDILLDYGLYDK